MRYTGISATYAVDDVARALAFYRDILGLDVGLVPLGVQGADVPPGMEVRLPDGHRLLVYPSPRFKPADFTVLTLRVPDIETAVDELTAKGVTFEQYDAPKTDSKGIHRDPNVKPVAWFRDPTGNIIALNQE
jgi:catechol 2,3-dioxygenase-like lactoylglutathione lyase family enzyme